MQIFPNNNTSILFSSWNRQFLSCFMLQSLQGGGTQHFNGISTRFMQTNVLEKSVSSAQTAHIHHFLIGWLNAICHIIVTRLNDTKRFNGKQNSHCASITLDKSLCCSRSRTNQFRTRRKKKDEKQEAGKNPRHRGPQQFGDCMEALLTCM